MIDSLIETTVDCWLRTLLGLTTDQSPFPWQLELFDQLRNGKIASALDIPTGLGKTSVMALWLAARACGARLPRRLVYVVDRRAVVDQATEVAVHLRQCLERESSDMKSLKRRLGIPEMRHLPISTLRGKFVDNREWLEDPALPAIVVGTVDMVGSRLLFEGYGVSRKMRPYQAGLLGVDTLTILDEAHLVPPFERLLEAIANGSATFGPVEALRTVIPPFRVMALSATGQTNTAATFRLTDEDKKPGTITRKRLDARKSLTIETPNEDESLPSALARQAWKLTECGTKPIRCLVFANQRRDADAARVELEKLVASDRKTTSFQGRVDIELFVGGRRVFEREQAADRLKSIGFIAGTSVERARPAFVFATSAAEVGVDLDADHMICDLVEWERMVQRLGRVNRRGEGDAVVRVIRPTAGQKDASEEQISRLDAVVELIQRLPVSPRGGFDASPGAILGLMIRADRDVELLQIASRATTPPPLHPPLTRPLVEAWSMTSLEEHSGRPEVAPWIRGWIEDEQPKTTIVWREVLPATDDGDLLGKEDWETFLSAAGPHAIELLETEAWQAAAWLKDRFERTIQRRKAVADSNSNSLDLPPSTDAASANSSAEGQSIPAIGPQHVAAVIIEKDGDPFLLRTNFEDTDKKTPLESRLRGSTLIVDVRLGGLGIAHETPGSVTGLLDKDSDFATDVGSAANGTSVLPFRVRRSSQLEVDSAVAASHWREEARIPIQFVDGDESAWIVVESHTDFAAETEEGRAVSAKRAQLLDEHQTWAERFARSLAERIGLDTRFGDVLAIAARLHDEGKKSKRWQRAFHASENASYAKTTKRPNLRLLGGYRHEFGSLPFAEGDPALSVLEPDHRDLCLHLIAAHHGRARPLIPITGADDPPSQLQVRARQVALRFATLEKRWGPWGLAWWESLLRAVDQNASRENDEHQEKGAGRG